MSIPNHFKPFLVDILTKNLVTGHGLPNTIVAVDVDVVQSTKLEVTALVVCVCGIPTKVLECD